MHAKPSKIMAVLLAFMLAVPAFADRTQLKPGWNLFSPEQDIEMGRQVSRDADAQLPIINDRQATAYLNALGRQLASRAPNSRQYPFQFKIVNDKSINAFALPGGFIYVNRGTFEAAANEAQLAGVIAHEIGHVVLRHGTNQASKAYAAQAPFALLGGVLGSNSVGAVATQLGLGFTVNSLLLKYSRDAERQADLMGTQILYDAGYDPNQMAQFFERLQAESKGRAIEFFSDHPNPENRIGNVNNEVVKLGGARPGARLDSPDFQDVKRILASASEPRNGRPTSNGRSPSRSGRPQRPSTRLIDFRSGDFQFRHPDNWQAYGQGSAVTIAPEGGIVSGSLAYGVMMALFEPHDDNGDRRITLGEATDQLIQEFRESNPQLRSARNHQRIRVDNQSALWTEMTNESPVGGRENDILVTAAAPDGTMYYFIAVAPQSEFPVYSNAFEHILSTVRFR
jgi:Zn-dependent protease with chaperone function